MRNACSSSSGGSSPRPSAALRERSSSAAAIGVTPPGTSSSGSDGDRRREVVEQPACSAPSRGRRGARPWRLRAPPRARPRSQRAASRSSPSSCHLGPQVLEQHVEVADRAEQRRPATSARPRAGPARRRAAAASRGSPPGLAGSRRGAVHVLGVVAEPHTRIVSLDLEQLLQEQRVQTARAREPCRRAPAPRRRRARASASAARPTACAPARRRIRPSRFRSSSSPSTSSTSSSTKCAGRAARVEDVDDVERHVGERALAVGDANAGATGPQGRDRLELAVPQVRGEQLAQLVRRPDRPAERLDLRRARSRRAGASAASARGRSRPAGAG